MKKSLLIIALFYSMLFAAKDDDGNAIKNFKAYPSSTNTEVDTWVEPYDKTFLPYAVCSEVKKLEITSVADSVKYYYDDKDNFEDYLKNRHYFCARNIVRVIYHVTCLNKLKYEGTFYFFSKPEKTKDPMLEDKAPIEKEYKARVHDWIERDVSCIQDDGSFNEACSEYDGNTYSEYEQHFNRDSLTESWSRQKVAYPEWKYMGDPGKKLAKPVLFVHGLGDDYKSWGVTSTVDADDLCENDATCKAMWPSFCDSEYGYEHFQWIALKKTFCSDEKKKEFKNYKEALLRTNPTFQKGTVKGYNLGSAPDIIARNQNIYVTDKNINNDGLYFFQAPGRINEDKRWEEASLEWDGKDETTSQSRKLYKKLEEVLDDFFDGTSIDWRTTPETVVDIVAHSQGGLIVREMLRGLVAENASTGSENPANHIGRVITVDTPHLGAATASANSKSIGQYPGLGKIVDDLNNPSQHTLAKIDVSLNYSNLLLDLGIIATTPLLGYIIPATLITSDYEVDLKGAYLGPYSIYLNVDPLVFGDIDFNFTEIDPLEDSRDQANYTRSIGKHLNSESSFMQNLNSESDGSSYPKKLDGSKLEIVPLYSENTKAVVSASFEAIAENLKISCPELEDDDSKVACVSLEEYLESKSGDFEDVAYGLVDIDGIDLPQDLLDLLNSLVDNWLANSDLIVEANSQMYQSAELGITSDLIPELKTPRKFVFHDALAPWETVTHLDLKMGNMAASARQGLDIACALHIYCDEVLAEKTDAGMLYLHEGAVALTGDFDISPLYLESGKQGSRISDGTNYLEAIYEPGIGSYVNYTDATGNLQQDIVLSSDFSTNPRIQRVGSIITVSFDNQSGTTFSKDYTMSNLSSQINYSIIADEGASLPKVVVGIGSASDQSTQVAPVSSNAWKKSKDVFVLHREARDDNESNTSRPRILVVNSSDKDIVGFKVAYYFTADPARDPVVEVDYPHIPITLENLGGDQWRFVLDATDSVLKTKSVFPNVDGWQIRAHYNKDWADFDHLDDWSADYNVGIPNINTKIVVYDANGRILWGQEPEMFKSVDDGIVASPKGVLSWNDSAPWENSTLKPQVTVKNTGSVALKDYHAKLWFRVPDGKTLYVPTDDWYTPVSKPSLKNIADNVWELDMYFDTYILYPDESVVEGNIGLHLTDWSTFDKTVCGIALIDAEENVIFGKIPSADECKSYDSPSLLNVQYVWNF